MRTFLIVFRSSYDCNSEIVAEEVKASDFDDALDIAQNKHPLLSIDYINEIEI